MRKEIEIEVGSDFSGVGAFDQAIDRIAKKQNFKVKNVFACDMDKFARESYLANYSAPLDYPENVYDRTIPKKSLDIYMTSPPCQSFSIAGKRKGKTDKRGILFFNSWEFINKNRPRFFVFENVKGLLSDDKANDKEKQGRTFKEWCNMLGGKSVNGVPVLFPFEESVPYHIYFAVLNTKDFGVPQNRERVFIVGIRDDEDNKFQFPKTEHLTKRLKDVIEDDVKRKYFLSKEAVNRLCYNKSNFASEQKTEDDIASTLCASDYKIARGMNVLNVKANTKKGFEIAEEGDSINYSNSNSKTRRGRVGKEVAQTLDTNCQQAILVTNKPIVRHQLPGHEQSGRIFSSEGISPAVHTQQGGNQHLKVCVPVSTVGRIKKNQNGRRFKDDSDTSFTITTQDQHGIFGGSNIRRLTPRECFRLQDFPDSFKFVVSDTQLYKQAGNSITVRVLEKILEKLPIVSK